MLKKILKWTGISFLVLLLILFIAPYVFQGQIKAKIAETINKNVDAKVSFADADLSLFRNFPQASVRVDSLLVINKAPFEGDTLVSFGEVNLVMSLRELFKGKEEPMQVDSFTSENGIINILFNKDGIGNFDIALKDQKEEDGKKSDPLSLKVKEYEVRNFRFRYYDARSKINMVIDSLDHQGTGDFAASKLDLVTKTKARLSLDMDNVNYMRNVALSLDAVLGIDLDKQTYTFKDNKALINKLPLRFNGSLQLLDDGQAYDLTFSTPTSDFQNFLGLIPSAYSGSLANVKTTGSFSVKGFAKGKLTDTTVPKFNIEMASDNASFQYPDLPKSVQDIQINTQIINDTGIMNDTYVNLQKLAFRIDQDVFNASATIRNVAENPLVAAKLNGTVNLGNLTRAYPVKLSKPLSGILKANVETNFDMKSVETSQYQNIRNQGTIDLSGFQYVDDNGKALKISQASVSFDPSRVSLKRFDATTGRTDLSVNGTLDNFYGFVFKNQVLKGNFNLSSNQFAVSDFMSADAPAKEGAAPSGAMKIPSNLDCTLNAKIGTVLYDNLTLKNVTGKVTVRDQTATLSDVRTSIFDGLITASGGVSTKEKVPTFDMDLSLNKIDIQQSFTQLDMLRNIAPIAGVINGKLNSTINVKGKLDPKTMAPDLKTLSGDLLGQLLSTTVNEKNSKLLSALSGNLKFIDISKLNLNDLKAQLAFENGKVTVKPFNLKYKDIGATIGGTHGFDQAMNYNVKLDVPAKYLGTEVNNLLTKLAPADAAKLDNVPINANLTGSFSSPKVSTDLKQATTSLVTQLVKQQKDKYTQQATNALGNLIKSQTGGTTTKDTTKSATQNAKETAAEKAKEKGKELLNGLFNKKKKEEKKE
ncbi:MULTISPECIES: AsmA-like C-terminal region-containing protein [unclassified Flavobacterium]|uniref:AsmA-like C-terminal region-containing protein n=1 Tax=unclassified Flavobacterium TaxID=196869 RepID=UPI001F13C2C5|nr:MULTISPECIES: AsmA-like C-terminal region-containing protein [unclassified Flavobacterium]UMY66760.1 AsmA-like C-terminal region-containing protein [Flavobacterium sp. HJ-32-4]